MLQILVIFETSFCLVFVMGILNDPKVLDLLKCRTNSVRLLVNHKLIKVILFVLVNLAWLKKVSDLSTRNLIEIYCVCCGNLDRFKGLRPVLSIKLCPS